MKKIVELKSLGFYTSSQAIIAKDIDGKIYTWGANAKGQLGSGLPADSISSSPTCISNMENPLKDKKIVDIYSGNVGTVFAKDSDNKIYSWGRNYDGELGNGTISHSNVPICINDIEENALYGKEIIEMYFVDRYNDTTMYAIDKQRKSIFMGK